VKTQRSLKTIFFSILCIAGFLGCGKKGDPSAPISITPEKIKDLTANPKGRAITLSWGIPQKNTDGSQLLDLKGFKIYRSKTDFEDECLECPKRFSLLYDIDYKTYMMNKPQVTKIEYSDRDLRFKNIYSYRVVSYNSANQLSPRSNAQEVFWDLPSLPPRRLQAELREKSVILSWEEPTALEDGSSLEGLVGYNLYRRVPDETYPIDPLNSKLINTLTCRDKGIEMDKDYFYTVRAVRKIREIFLESEGCEEVTINTTDRTSPVAPTGVIAIPTKMGIILKWSENKESDLRGYNLYRKAEGEANFKRLNTTFLTRSGYLDRLVIIKKSYTYTVTAIDDATLANESEPSEGVTILYRY
jgi:hypothetical protein